MKKDRKVCWEKTLAMFLAAAILFSGEDLTVLATETDTQKSSQETVMEEKPSGEEEPSEEKLPGGGQSG